MSWGGPTFVLAIIAMSTLGWIVTSWIRARHGYPLESEWGGTVKREDPDAARTIALLSSENEKIEGKVSRLEERIAVLERIVTDPALRLDRQIDALRDDATNLRNA